TGGRWVAVPVLAAWKTAFGVPSADHSVLGVMASWALDWPLSLTLLISGVGILAAIAVLRWAREKRRRQLRRKWISDQCTQAGYTPWNVKKVLADLDASPPLNHGRREQGLR
ncbi:MAG: hypothetical protein ACTSW2_02600, partial [Alphaproteobacteria bacterium]